MELEKEVVSLLGSFAALMHFPDALLLPGGPARFSHRSSPGCGKETVWAMSPPAASILCHRQGCKEDYRTISAEHHPPPSAGLMLHSLHQADYGAAASRAVGLITLLVFMDVANN